MHSFSADREGPLSSLVKWRLILLVLAAIMSGPLFVRFPYSPSFLKEFAALFAAFLIIILLWEIELAYIAKFIFHSNAKLSRVAKFLRLLPAFILSILVFYWLGHIESKVEEIFFLSFVAVLGLRAVTKGLSLSPFRDKTVYFSIAVLFLLSCLSLALSSGVWSWQFVVLAFSMVSGLIAQACLAGLLGSEESFGAKVYLRLHSLFLFMAPSLVLMLVYLDQLERSYLIMILSFAPVMRAAEKGRRLEEQKQIEVADLLQLEKLSIYSSIAFILALVSAMFIKL